MKWKGPLVPDSAPSRENMCGELVMSPELDKADAVYAKIQSVVADPKLAGRSGVDTTAFFVGCGGGGGANGTNCSEAGGVCITISEADGGDELR